ncbi:MAG TPA: alpha/beta hydrolase [Draconibacterium sp.]|nr:alpha/beta hydrolase [Draconibacterium sp.]
MDAQTRFTHFLLKLVDAKKLASNTMLQPKRAKEFNYPNRLKKYQIDSFLAQNRNVITFGSTNQSLQKHIIFLHGGAYTVGVNSGHWWMVEQILKLASFKISFIQYPLAPEHNYKQTHAMIAEAYSELTSRNPDDRFYLLGDSAGGGLCLAFAQTLSGNVKKKPEKIALLSPWLDLSMSNPDIKELEQKDLLLSAETLKKCGKWYADGMDLKSPVLSPLYGNMKDLNGIGIFVGTEEILLPDCRLLKQKIEQSNTSVYYKEYEGMQHDWIVFPIKERNILLKDVIQFLNS